MESGIQNKQRPFRTIGNVFWSMQLPSDIPEHDERHFRHGNQ